jgi:NAD(P)-dependent dehydrogenase (short-subunit alcohol dehydrogenase family)
MAKPLTGKIALVTGSGRGLGRLMAERLAAQGADIVLHDKDWTAPAQYGEGADLGAVEEQFRRFGVRTLAVTGNIGEAAAVAAMKEKIEAELGPVDILVNCAGGDIGAKGGKPEPNNALDIPLEDVAALTNNNLIGTITVCKTFIPPMRDRKSGIVVNIGSVAGHLGVSNGAIYAILKAAVAHYTRCLATELRPFGVRVNCVAPGPSKTARFEATRVVDPEMMNSNKASLDRYAEPGEIADAVAFLTSHEAKFINGQVLCVDGGLVNWPS